MADEEEPPIKYRNGFPLLPRREGRKIRLEDIQRIQEELDRDDAERAYDLNGWHERNPDL